MMMLKYEARLCPTYRGVDDCLAILSDLEYLEDYEAGSRNGFKDGYGADMSRRVLEAIEAAIALVNRMTAIYRDVSHLPDEVPRIKFDGETGAPELTRGWGEASLRSEVLWFLATEAAKVKQVPERRYDVPPSQ